MYELKIEGTKKEWVACMVPVKLSTPFSETSHHCSCTCKSFVKENVSLDISKKYIRVEGGAYKSILVCCPVISITPSHGVRNRNMEHISFISIQWLFICGKLEITHSKRMD
jgi:hypothetical protein